MNLVERLMEELRVTREQAEGGAGLLLQFAQHNLPREAFVAVAGSIPAISDIIGKAPRGEMAPVRAWRAMLSRLFGGLGGMAGLAEPFARMGLDELQIRKFIDVLLHHFREKGGAEIEGYLVAVFR
ncbi:MAG: DUF2780 domain-containing protein [Planctomycetales bacterium]|nr:DUF2780 domain-containing protein [Planctomycetales bacterium]